MDHFDEPMSLDKTSLAAKSLQRNGKNELPKSAESYSKHWGLALTSVIHMLFVDENISNIFHTPSSTSTSSF